ncbi:hypothetical protein MRB53_006754 [Persea americana]|uniref:Uncharacterized protein n=1 Tax=Persea americana TaxID=3435 RepID=A0ACC2MHZ8_PERAE|nr:hypothetical protein MRB53_006754 [Persea americana]
MLNRCLGHERNRRRNERGERRGGRRGRRRQRPPCTPQSLLETNEEDHRPSLDALADRSKRLNCHWRRSSEQDPDSPIAGTGRGVGLHLRWSFFERPETTVPRCKSPEIEKKQQQGAASQCSLQNRTSSVTESRNPARHCIPVFVPLCLSTTALPLVIV